MAYKRFARITGPEDSDPGNQWCYRCDTEADVTASLPDEAIMAIVAQPDSGHSAVRIRKSDGTWKELG